MLWPRVSRAGLFLRCLMKLSFSYFQCGQCTLIYAAFISLQYSLKISKVNACIRMTQYTSMAIVFTVLVIVVLAKMSSLTIGLTFTCGWRAIFSLVLSSKDFVSLGTTNLWLIRWRVWSTCTAYSIEVLKTLYNMAIAAHMMRGLHVNPRGKIRQQPVDGCEFHSGSSRCFLHQSGGRRRMREISLSEV